MSQIQIFNERMKKCVEQNQHVFVGYITAGYPDRETFFELVEECANRGLSILEVGFPSGDPYEDGEVIRKAHEQVGTDLCRDMEFWRQLRSRTDIPIWLMGYEKDLIQTGIYRTMAEEKLFDALVISNMGIADRVALKKEMQSYGVDVVGFVSNDDSFHEVAESSKEFKIIYQRLYTGPTGVKNDSTDYEELLDYSQMFCKNVVFGGFGISSGSRVRELLERGFFGTIIGTEMMRKLNRSREELYDFVEELSGIVKEENGKWQQRHMILGQQP